MEILKKLNWETKIERIVAKNSSVLIRIVINWAENILLGQNLYDTKNDSFQKVSRTIFRYLLTKKKLKILAQMKITSWRIYFE